MNTTTKNRRRLEVLPTPEDVTRVAAELITAAALISIAKRRAFRIALAGGSTPRPVYELLAADRDIDWRKWHLFWGDERTVPPTDPQSNYAMTREALLDRLSTPPGLVVRMAGELPPDEAALRYEHSVRQLVAPSIEDKTGDLPRFDLILLGMGDDAHTASLFPQTLALEEQERLVVANPVPKLESTRLTFTYPLINAARRVLILATGEGKAKALRKVISGTHDPQRRPVQGIAPVSGQLTWLVDEAAFSKVQKVMDKG